MSRRTSNVLWLAILVVCIVAMPRSSAATKLCPVLPVDSNGYCECDVANYGTTADPGVVINTYNYSGSAVATCRTTVYAKHSVYCQAHFLGQDTCACEVTGEGTK